MSEEELAAYSAQRSDLSKRLWQDPAYAAKTLSAMEAGRRRQRSSAERAADAEADSTSSTSSTSSSRSSSSRKSSAAGSSSSSSRTRRRAEASSSSGAAEVNVEVEVEGQATAQPAQPVTQPPRRPSTQTKKVGGTRSPYFGSWRLCGTWRLYVLGGGGHLLKLGAVRACSPARLVELAQQPLMSLPCWQRLQPTHRLLGR